MVITHIKVGTPTNIYTADEMKECLTHFQGCAADNLPPGDWKDVEVARIEIDDIKANKAIMCASYVDGRLADERLRFVAEAAAMLLNDSTIGDHQRMLVTNHEFKIDFTYAP